MLKLSSDVSDVFPKVLRLSCEVSECKPLLQGDSTALLSLVERLPDEAKRSEVRAVHATRSQAAAAATDVEVERLTLHDDAALAVAQDHAQSLQWGRDVYVDSANASAAAVDVGEGRRSVGRAPRADTPGPGGGRLARACLRAALVSRRGASPPRVGPGRHCYVTPRRRLPYFNSSLAYIARHVFQRILNPLLLRSLASYDVASDIRRARLRGGHEQGWVLPVSSVPVPSTVNANAANHSDTPSSRSRAGAITAPAAAAAAAANSRVGASAAVPAAPGRGKAVQVDPMKPTLKALGP